MTLEAGLLAEKIRPLRREEYERLVEMGCFSDERVELLQGRIVEMSPQGPGRYTELRTYGPEQRVTMQGFADVEVSVGEVFRSPR